MSKRQRASHLKVRRADKLKILVIALAVGSPLLWFIWSTTSSPTPNSEDSRIPAFFETEERAKPLPLTLNPELFRNTVFEAYQTAEEIPGVLAQQPCYCKCDRASGHRGLIDCYRDSHAATCLICIKEAVLARKLNKDGVSAADIRKRIILGDWQNITLSRELSSTVPGH